MGVVGLERNKLDAILELFFLLSNQQIFTIKLDFSDGR